MPELTLFAGPSTYGVARSELLCGGAKLRPPVRRGDIDGLVQTAPVPGVVVVCDGVFQGEPAVSHAELCRAIDAGWKVWGVSSIGAIRAYELRSEGMRGFGYVYSQFFRFADFSDDEMCMLHFPEEPYFPVSEALVNLRYVLEQKRVELGLSDLAQRRLLAALKDLWFGDRTEETIRRVMCHDVGIAAASADALLAWLRLHRVKTIDLVTLMTSRPWLG